MKKLILSALAITIVFSIVGCKKDDDASCGNDDYFFRANGWKGINITIDTSNNGIDDPNIVPSCYDQAYEIIKTDGTTQLNFLTTTCPTSCSHNRVRTWWWDPTSECHSRFYFKDPNHCSDTTTKLCNILKLTNDTFRYSVITEIVNYTDPNTGARINYFWSKAKVTAIPY